MINRVEEYAIKYGLSKKTPEYSRRNEDKWRRQYLFYFLRSKGCGFEKIGKAFGLDHATVINGIKRYHELKRYEDYQNVIADVKFEFPIEDGLFAEHKHLRVNQAMKQLQLEYQRRYVKNLIRKEVKKVV